MAKLMGGADLFDLIDDVVALGFRLDPQGIVIARHIPLAAGLTLGAWLVAWRQFMLEGIGWRRFLPEVFLADVGLDLVEAGVLAAVQAEACQGSSYGRGLGHFDRRGIGQLGRADILYGPAGGDDEAIAVGDGRMRDDRRSLTEAFPVIQFGDNAELVTEFAAEDFDAILDHGVMLAALHRDGDVVSDLLQRPHGVVETLG